MAVTVANGGFQQFKYESLIADTTYNGGRIGIDARLIQVPGTELTVKGALPVSALRPNPPGTSGHSEAAAGDEIDLTIKSTRVDLGIVQGFTTRSPTSPAPCRPTSGSPDRGSTRT